MGAGWGRQGGGDQTTAARISVKWRVSGGKCALPVSQKSAIQAQATPSIFPNFPSRWRSAPSGKRRGRGGRARPGARAAAGASGCPRPWAPPRADRGRARARGRSGPSTGSGRSTGSGSSARSGRSTPGAGRESPPQTRRTGEPGRRLPAPQRRPPPAPRPPKFLGHVPAPRPAPSHQVRGGERGRGAGAARSGVSRARGREGQRG